MSVANAAPVVSQAGAAQLTPAKSRQRRPNSRFLRSELWNPDCYVDRDELPSNGQLLRAVSGESIDAAQYDEERAARYARREGFY